MNYPHDRIVAAREYVRRIQNKAKKKYAIAYFDYLLSDDEEEPDRGELGVMGAQAVRLSLRALLPETLETR